MATSQAQEILSNLEKEILPTEYSRYIKNLKFNDKNSTPQFFIYNATNEFIAKYAQTKYGTKIKELIKYLRGLNDALNIPHCIKNYGADSYPTENGFVPENVFL